MADTLVQAPHAAVGSTPASMRSNTIPILSNALTQLLADFFALYLKTKNFHWHVSGPHFADYHRLLDDQAQQLLAATDPLAERVRKIGGTTLKSIGHISRLQQIGDSDAEDISPEAMLAELLSDNATLAQRLRRVHALCDEHGDVASVSLLDTWLDEAEGRSWFLSETARSRN